MIAWVQNIFWKQSWVWNKKWQNIEKLLLFSWCLSKGHFTMLLFQICWIVKSLHSGRSSYMICWKILQQNQLCQQLNRQLVKGLLNFFSSACLPTIVLGCTCSFWLFDTSHFLKQVEWGWVISVNCIWRKFLFVDNGWIRLSLSNLTSWQLSLPHSSWQSMTFVNYLLQKFPSWLTQLLFVQHNLLFQLIICGHWTALFARHKFYLPKLVDQDWIFSFNSKNS